MKILKSVQALRAWRGELSGTCGFVPTMGALHRGHCALFEESVQASNHTVVSIFVNPTQFNDPEDFEKYPSTLEADCAQAEAAGVDAVFLPEAAEIYSDGQRFSVEEAVDSRVMEGVQRPGHFSGVLTVVLKLLNIVRPDYAFFGEKDFQQFRLIRDMAQALFLDCEIRMGATVRESSGLAFSSRNVRLGEAARSIAPVFFEVLQTAPSLEAARRTLSEKGFAVEYVEEHWDRRFGAVQLDGVRLIDNLNKESIHGSVH